MVKTRILLGVIAVLLIAGMFVLPKVVVENEAQTQVSSQEPSAVSDAQQEAIAQAHSIASTDELQIVINAYKDSLISAGNSKKSIIFADSLASLYRRINRPDSAVTFIEDVVEAKPGVDTWTRAGDAYYEAYGLAADPAVRSDYAARAREYYLKVLEEQPSNMDIKNRVAMTWLASPTPMQGILTLREIIQEDPGNEQATFNLGVLSMQSGQYDKAVERFESLIEKDPSNIEAHFFLGVSYLELGNSSQAREEFEFVRNNANDPAVVADAESYLESI